MVGVHNIECTNWCLALRVIGLAYIVHTFFCWRSSWKAITRYCGAWKEALVVIVIDKLAPSNSWSISKWFWQGAVIGHRKLMLKICSKETSRKCKWVFHSCLLSHNLDPRLLLHLLQICQKVAINLSRSGSTLQSLHIGESLFDLILITWTNLFLAACSACGIGF